MTDANLIRKPFSEDYDLYKNGVKTYILKRKSWSENYDLYDLLGNLYKEDGLAFELRRKPWSNGYDLYKGEELFDGIIGGEEAPWLPTDIDGCKLWLRNDLGITKDELDRISLRADQSGNGNDFAQATDAQKPVWTAGLFNGHPGVVWDGIDDIMTSSFTLAQPTIWFVVFKITRSPINVYQFFFDSTSGPRQLFGTIPTGKWLIYSDLAILESTIDADNLPHIASIIFNGASSQVWLDGESIITGNSGTSTIVNATLGRGIGDAGVMGWDAEIICYDATSFTDADRQRVELYLNTESQGTGYAIY